MVVLLSGSKRIFSTGRSDKAKGVRWSRHLLSCRRWLARCAVASAFLNVCQLATAQAIATTRVAPAYCAVQRDAISFNLALVDALKQRWPTLQVVTEPAACATDSRSELIYIAVGEAALSSVVAHDRGALTLALLLPRHRLEALAGMIGARTTAIYAETHPIAQLQLAQRLFGRSANVGVILRREDIKQQSWVASAAREVGVHIEMALIEPDALPMRAVSRLRNVDALLALADPTVLNESTVRPLLESTYRQLLPVIGFTSNLAAAGAIASTFVSPQDLATHAIETLREFSSGKLPPLQYPRYWRVSVNNAVARSLNVYVSPEVTSSAYSSPRLLQ
jgi:putative tryptophan/tyrosine transport system substrate-binding protein